MLKTRSESDRSCIFPIYILSFAVLFVFLLWKCRYGYATKDEAFYLTIPYRLCQGDCLLLHEWHLSQLSGFLLYPAVWVYLLLHNGTEQICLHFRYLFTIVWAITAVFLYLRLKVFSRTGAMFASLAFLVYTPFGIMALSYNSLGILLLVSSCAVAATAEKHFRLQHFIAGLLFAGAVLCCPYLLILYLLFTTVSIVLLFRHKRDLLTRWVWISWGCVFLLLVFCAFLLSRGAKAKEILMVIPAILDDPEHAAIPFGQRLVRYLSAVYHCNPLFPVCFALSVLCILLPLVWKKTAAACFAAVCFTCTAFIMGFLLHNPYLNYLMFPINLAAPYCAVHCKAKTVRVPFFTIWIPGAIYTLCIFWTSNQAFYVISSVSAVMAVATIVMLFASIPYLTGPEHTKRRNLALIVPVVILLIAQLSGEVYLRYTSVFKENGMAKQTVVADSGPEGGIKMTKKRLDDYHRMQDDILVIQEHNEIKQVLFLSADTVMYLMTEKEMAAYSAWLSGVNENSISRLDRYYSFFPDKRPDGILIDAKYEAYIEHFLTQGYRLETLQTGDFLLIRQANSLPNTANLPFASPASSPA